MSNRLNLFVREALGRGVPRSEVESTLLNARWPADEVAAALDAYVEVDFPIPVPRPKPYVSARDAFGYLVLFSTLYTSATAFIKLIYHFINRAFPDAAQQAYVWGERASESMRWSTASLLIAFPVYLALSRRAYRATRKDPESRTSKIRKWLTYLTLFVAAAALLCDGIALVHSLLGGELTIRFILKVLTIATVAGSVFGYYLWDLRQDDMRPEELHKGHPGIRVATIIVILVVATAAVASFLTIDAPDQVRSKRLDNQRLQHLGSIAGNIDAYWNLRRELPPTLEAIAADRTNAPRDIHDPVTGETYDYTPGADGAYQLCAKFEAADPEPQVYGGQRFWGHGAGRHCFEVEVESWRTSEE